MQRYLAGFLVLAAVWVHAAVVFAEGSLFDMLRELSQQGSDETAVQAGTIRPGDGLLVVPDRESVALDIELEVGVTLSDRLAAYVGALEDRSRASGGSFTTLVRLGLAYQMGEQHAEARQRLEQALDLEPQAMSLYSALAQSMARVAPGLKVYVGGRPVTFDVEPVVVNGRTLVPIRAVADRLGATVEWDAVTATATVTLGSQRVEVTRGSAVAIVNGQPVALDVPATIVGGRTLLPLRFVSENLEMAVSYHAGPPGTAVISILSH